MANLTFQAISLRRRRNGLYTGEFVEGLRLQSEISHVAKVASY